MMLEQSDISPLDVRPHGDRLFVEVVEISDEVKVNGVALYTAARNIRDGQGKLTEEYQRGFCAGIVIAVGDGHVLTTGGTQQSVPIYAEIENVMDVPFLSAYDAATKQAIVTFTSTPRVPMPWAQGDVVLMERLARRTLEIRPREFAMIDQMDILATLERPKFKLVDMKWVRVEAPVDVPA